MSTRVAAPSDRRTASALKLWVVLSRAYGAIASRLTDRLSETGLTDTEFGALEALYHKGPLLLGELQKSILVSSGGITYVVDRLEREGLVERRPCSTDRRARYAALTPRGERLIGEIFPDHAEQVRLALGGLNEEEKQQATSLLRRLGTHAAEGSAREP